MPPSERVERDRTNVRTTAKGRIELDGACVEVREFEWERAGWVMPDPGHFYISQLLSPLKGERKIRWHDPDDGRPLAVSQFGVHDPSAPMLIAHGPGSACFLICQIEVARFRRMTGTSAWPKEWALRGLASGGPFFKAILDRLTGEILHPHTDSARLVDALLTAFVIELCRTVRREAPAERGGLAEWQLDRIRSLVRGTRAGELTIARIAQRCGVSVRHLTRAFRAAEGRTLHDYIAETRLARARELLAAGEKPLKLVATEAGFATPSHFSAAFRRAIGCSPSEYRASVRSV